MEPQTYSIASNQNLSIQNTGLQKPKQTAREIQEWMVSYLANLLEINPNEIDITVSFDRYGLDSSAAVGMTGDLEDWLGFEVDPTLVYDYPTIETLAQYLVKINIDER